MAIQRYKLGTCNCDDCKGMINVPGHKTGKVFMCLKSHNAMKRNEQAEKAAGRQKARMLSNSNPGTAYRPVEDKMVSNKALTRINLLNDFFKLCAIEIAKDPYCEECGQWISPADYRNATAHILPKEFFRSIETNPLCWLKLGPRCGCHNKTHTLLTFSKMKVFPKAVAQLREIEPLITETHKLLGEFWNYAATVIVFPLKINERPSY